MSTNAARNNSAAPVAGPFADSAATIRDRYIPFLNEKVIPADDDGYVRAAVLRWRAPERK
jgi:hypothetical protein